MTIRRHVALGALVVIVSLLTVFLGCGRKTTWQNVSRLTLNTRTILPGKRVRIVPVAYSYPTLIQGSQVGVSNFKFAGTLLDTSADLKVNTQVTLLFESSAQRGTETQKAPNLITWSKDKPKKQLQFSFVVSPSEGTYAGDGHLYFYLTDADGVCVSNIVAWPVTFK